jgi:hypothetical protein
MGKNIEYKQVRLLRNDNQEADVSLLKLACLLVLIFMRFASEKESACFACVFRAKLTTHLEPN